MRSNKRKIKVSVGVFAYNEAKNIAKTLKSIQDQKLDRVVVDEIFVVSSGSFDETNAIVERMAKKDRRITLVEQLRREGKSSAINLFMSAAGHEVLVIVSGDLRLAKTAIEEIVRPFFYESVGMVGAKPVPKNIQSNPVGNQVKIMWELHHLVSLVSPKCGEMVAYRNVLRKIPKQSAVDEATIEVLMHMVGYDVLYAPRSVVYNKGPRSVRDFIKQRKRVYIGHQWVAKHYNYHVSTMRTGSTFGMVQVYLGKHPEDFWPMVKLILLELYSRWLGWWDYYVFRKNPYVWDMVER